MKILGWDVSVNRDRVKLSRPSTNLPRRAYRNFEAASTNLLVGSLPTTNINVALASQLHRLRAMSRLEARNNPLGRRYVNLCRTNVVGPRGVSMQAQIHDRDGRLDKWANDAVELAWAHWGRPGNCTANRQDSWLDVKRLVITSLATDGEILIEEVAVGPHGYGLRLIDPELLDVRYNEVLGDGRRVVMGVEINADFVPVAYHLLSDTSDTLLLGMGYTGSGFTRRRVPADQLRHIFLPEAVGQVRGVPWLVPGLLRSKMFDGFAEAALANARAGAAKMGHYITPDGEGFGDSETDKGEFLDYSEPGHFGVLPPGYQFQAFDPTYPSGEYATFAEDHKRDISAAWNVGYNTLTNDLRGVSYSSIRTAVLEDRESWKMLQEFLIERLVRPVYERWLLHALLYGQVIQANGSALPATKYEKFRAARFNGRRWSWIDPQKDVTASKLAIETKLTSRRRVIQDMGLDPEEVWEELAAEDALFGGAKPDKTDDAKPEADEPEADETKPEAEEDADEA